MATLAQNDFSTYVMTDQEMLQGTILTVTQKQVIQNKLSILAHEKINLEVDSNNMQFFLQQEASLKGAMDELRFILEMSGASEETIRADAGLATQPEV